MITYELLDEMMDNGYPQTTEALDISESSLPEKVCPQVKILREYIKTQSHQWGAQGTLLALVSWVS